MEFLSQAQCVTALSGVTPSPSSQSYAALSPPPPSYRPYQAPSPASMTWCLGRTSPWWWPWWWLVLARTAGLCVMGLGAGVVTTQVTRWHYTVTTLHSVSVVTILLTYTVWIGWQWSTQPEIGGQTSQLIMNSLKLEKSIVELYTSTQPQVESKDLFKFNKMKMFPKV